MFMPCLMFLYIHILINPVKIPTTLILYLCIFATFSISPVILIRFCVLLFSGECADHPGAALQPAKC